MTITINPYADILNFPPGTPASVINAVLAMRSRNDAMANQPNWWEQGINNVLTGFNKDLLTPWLQNNLVNLPYQTDLSTMRTDQAMREFSGNQGVLTSEENQRALNKYALEQQAQADLGGAIGMATQAYQGTPESFTDTGPTTPYGSYEDPWSTSPGPTYSPPLSNLGPTGPSGDQPTQPGVEPTQLQGDIAPTNRDRIMKYTREYNPTSADMFRTVAGQSPLNAGILAQLFEKNKNLSSLLDPVQQKFINSQIAKNDAQSGNLESQTNSRNTLLPANLQALVNRGILTEAQAQLVNSQTLLTNEKGAQQGFITNSMAQASPEEMKRAWMKGGSGEQKLPASVAARMTVIQGHNPNIDPIDALDQAIRENYQANPINNLLLTQSKLPIDIARNEIPKLDQQVRELRSFNGNIDQVNEVMQRLASSNLLPKDQSWISQLEALKNRTLHPDLYNADEVNGALEVLARLKNGISVGYDRAVLGDKGARVAPAYNLPKDPTMISIGAWNGYYNAIKTGINSDLGDAIATYTRAKNDAMNTRFGSPSLSGPSDIEGTTQPKGFGKPSGFRTTP